MNEFELNALDWQKMNGLLPAIIQHAENGTVLMLGYMNQESLSATLSSGQLTLYSRSKQKLWRKGETSGNSMTIRHISTDCDKDSLLIHVIPKGPACHLGYTSCFQPPLTSTLGFLDGLIDLINDRARQNSSHSYTAQLLNEGLNKCAQKVGEEAVETVIAAVNRNREELINETADLIFHLLVLLKSCELSFYEVLQCLQDRDRSVHT
ncbi:bifunctional phosphoribosyl-AMP cyclohydrolase/phosphoribosyl-ATP diphosphatase HisIE [Legionella bononiensis]|uniref:Histidine biosynthesis bifunctional protein HisIE n=1 Tax=Legionella bononiensis TaxID=2793102 RepID=A0ABS1WBV5_9GAMM|nr:bifunctional phosphoribosyl-AMP cyclohydrolase/phosphoribosyl-ATP diphosphatase HisIE [Legionella bononiensis]MBL7481126.1 bifunctional phosphoribosyl-AMP cyclohydrolase/phosphoribosyl-ATP diphosphatase HisIE [Legionella bononiensis]MBL7526835.1 bifunctional phosphoribosyl-AMP cyclohydrolase/phosphoribosyl-ATP diphosphatase HisIE [Legionella bononiensis]MBL7564242.1 bifunctional phosphoribosyl-AMP cyclohydrolase/phosphoribosyl-ATP diphosphatase HisIE [Legionella bononiensis]